MTLKAHTIIGWMEARTGGAPDASAAIDTANQAGELLVSPPNARTWSYYKRRTLLNIVSGQDYLPLPDNFASAQYVQYRDSRLEVLDSTTVASVLEETRVPGVARNFTGIIYEVPSGASEAVPRLLLSKTPTASETNAVRLYYTAGWQELADPTSEVDIAHWMVPLYRELVLAVQLGWEEPDSSPSPSAAASAHVAAVWAGPIAASAFARDAKVQRYVGLPNNTIGSSGLARLDHFNETVILTP